MAKVQALEVARERAQQVMMPSLSPRNSVKETKVLNKACTQQLGSELIEHISVLDQERPCTSASVMGIKWPRRVSRVATPTLKSPGGTQAPSTTIVGRTSMRSMIQWKRHRRWPAR